MIAGREGKERVYAADAWAVRLFEHPSRPDYSWPGGRRLAVYIALNIEAFGFGVGKGAAIAPPDQAQSHSVYSWRDYGNRVGIWRLFELLDELGLPAEAQLNTAVYERRPTSPRGCAPAATRSWATG